MSLSLSDFHPDNLFRPGNVFYPGNVLSSPTSMLYSGTLLNQAYAILVNFPRPSNGFAYPFHFAALVAFSGASALLTLPLLLPDPNPSFSATTGNVLMTLSISLFTWTAYTTQKGRLSAIFGGKTPDFIIDYGPFGYIRHPAYAAYLLGWTGTLIALAGKSDAGWRIPALAVCLLGVGVVYHTGVQMEERQLLSGAENEGKIDLGKKYKQYMGRVRSRWLPGIY
jgi:protein-S-isoprenylcysteine O-methyltransferase Ste14